MIKIILGLYILDYSQSEFSIAVLITPQFNGAGISTFLTKM